MGTTSTTTTTTTNKHNNKIILSFNLMNFLKLMWVHHFHCSDSWSNVVSLLCALLQNCC
jgi:hypothetical protein